MHESLVTSIAKKERGGGRERGRQHSGATNSVFSFELPENSHSSLLDPYLQPSEPSALAYLAVRDHP